MPTLSVRAFAPLLLSITIAACGGGGKSESGPPPAVPPMQAPAVTDLEADPSSHGVTLSWTAPEGATGFNVFISSAPRCNTANFASCPDGALMTKVTSPLTVHSLRNGQAYFFQIESVDGTGTRKLSNEAGARPNSPSLNDRVTATAVAPDGTVYLGGNFTRAVRVTTGGALPLDGVTGRFSTPDFPIVDGIVLAIVPDGNGGWFIGGGFTSVGGMPRSSLAHVSRDGQVDPVWAPQVIGRVQALALSGNTVYVGGLIFNQGDEESCCFAAFDATTGASISWSPNANGAVESLAVAGNTVYAAGGFETVDGLSRRHLVALDAGNGEVRADWNPGAAFENSSAVHTLSVSNGTVYVGGNFFRIGAANRGNLAAFDAVSGALTDWNPNANNGVYSLALAGSTVYAGGYFTEVGGAQKRSLAALDRTTGVVSPTFDAAPDDGVLALAIDGNTLYAGGDFTQIGGSAHSRVAALDAASGTARPNWRLDIGGSINALAAAGGAVYAGGSDVGLGPVERSRLAALDADGMLTAWNPRADAVINTLAIAGDTIYAGGAFTNIGGQFRSRLAALDRASGNATAWDPNVDKDVAVPSTQVSAISVAGNTIYAGGFFAAIGDDARHNIAAVDATTGRATAWSPNADDVVLALAVSGNTVYAGGYFTTMGNVGRNHIAAIDATTGAATPWNPSIDGFVAALALTGNTIYAGGFFTHVGDDAHENLAAIDVASGNATAWNPRVAGRVSALALFNNAVYVVGSFFRVGDDNRSGAAALDVATGRTAAWNPNVRGDGLSLALDGDVAYIGGSFQSLGGAPRGNIGAVSATGNGAAQ